MALIAFGVLVCAYGELNLVVKGLVLQLSALGFEVRAPHAHCTRAEALEGACIFLGFLLGRGIH